jgi:N6-L-threonylcarbamoyladenine synthase
MSNQTILAIETSCDETAAVIVNDNREILADEIISQEDHEIHG